MGIFCSFSTKHQVHDNNLVCNSNSDVNSLFQFNLLFNYNIISYNYLIIIIL